MDGLREGARIAMGSLPGLDPVAAVQTQFRVFPEIPAWPQLPKRSFKELITFQGLSGLPGLSWPTNEQAVFTLSPGDLAEALEILRSENKKNNFSRAAFKTDEASGFFAFLNEARRFMTRETLAVKGQCAGPVTLGLTLRDEGGKPLLTSPDSMKVLTEYLLLHCRWQIEKLSALEKQVVFFLDEPFLNGRFQPEQYGITWKDIEGWLSTLLEPLQDEGVLTGLHSCGEGPWDWAFGMPIEFFHFDAYQHLHTLTQNSTGFNQFIRQGGMVSFGMVPTAMNKGVFPDPAELFQMWEDSLLVLQKRGLDRETLISQTYFSTACGLGNSSISLVEESARCLGTLVSLWRANISLR